MKKQPAPVAGITRYITYYRVSTKKQGESGLGLEAQRAAVAGFVKGLIPFPINPLISSHFHSRNDE